MKLGVFQIKLSSLNSGDVQKRTVYFSALLQGNDRFSKKKKQLRACVCVTDIVPLLKNKIHFFMRTLTAVRF